MNRVIPLVIGVFLWLAVPASVVLIAATGADAGRCASGGPAEQIRGVDLDTEQLANARTIIGVVRDWGPPATRRAAVVAVMTALQESSLRNDLRQLDHDSIGLFQQRVSIYGAATASDPVGSTRAFLTKLLRVRRWDTRPPTEVAAEVQVPREDLRGRYAAWQPLAQTLTDRFWQGVTAGCTGGADDPDLVTGGSVPDGYRLPSDAQARVAVEFALAQLGEPYVFGANGPDTWDCSSLMQRAWAAAGVAIPRVTYDQVHTGVAVAGLAAMRPGDLILIPGSDGTMSQPGHVGMYIGVAGDGTQYLVQAPQSGDVVKVSAVSSWSGQIAAIRRPVRVK